MKAVASQDFDATNAMLNDIAYTAALNQRKCTPFYYNVHEVCECRRNRIFRKMLIFQVWLKS